MKIDDATSVDLQAILNDEVGAGVTTFTPATGKWTVESSAMDPMLPVFGMLVGALIMGLMLGMLIGRSDKLHDLLRRYEEACKARRCRDGEVS